MSRQVSPFSNESTGTARTASAESPSVGRNKKNVRRNLCNSLGAETGLDLHTDWESEDEMSGSIASNNCFSVFRKYNARINTHSLAAEASLDLHMDWEEEDRSSALSTAPHASAARSKYGSVGGFECEISENLIFS
mmetsp:Transcript_60563/g.94191  ORF Transcript_60563/g.94191 Transcript_60563/m.94191 type:complete len:136 (-) Transcript_60563:169-576(-)